MKTNKRWLQDYEEFLNNDTRPSVELSNMVNQKIHQLLNPNALIVFLKILAIHLVVGFMSLSICHQFGMNPFNTNRSLETWMMHFGGYRVCMFGCGVLFVGLSFLAAGIFLKIEEVKALRRTELLQTLALGLISLGLFVAFGTELAIGIACIWLLGALVGGLLGAETVWRLKHRVF